MRPPNFLILMADQMRAAALRTHGGQALTPHIDALAARGAVFERFYCNSPLCAPSRFSLMSGQLPSKIGAYDNAAEFSADTPTFAHYLRAAGYQTALSGKMHFCGPDQLHGFERRLTTDIYPADFGWTPDWTRFEERPGWYHTMDSVTQAGTCARTNQIDFDDEVVYAARQELFDIARGKDRRPFCLVVSMTHPHDPYAITPPYWERYERVAIEMPRVTAADVPDDPHSARIRHVIGLGTATPTAAQVRAARRAYLGSCSYVDDQVGVLMDTLAQSGLADNTIVCVIADHGDMLGERGLWYKMSFFESACRIPLIMAGPGIRPRRIAQLSSLVDLLPTLTALAGAPEPAAAPVDGTSLAPALAGTERPGEVIGEYLAEGAIAPIIMIRREHAKFIHTPVDPDQLYDLAADPDERHNLATVRAEEVAHLRAQIDRRWDLAAVQRAVLASQQRRHFVNHALRQGQYKAWDHQPFRDAARQYVRNDQELNDLEAMARFPPVSRQ